MLFHVLWKPLQNFKPRSERPRSYFYLFLFFTFIFFQTSLYFLKDYPRCCGGMDLRGARWQARAETQIRIHMSVLSGETLRKGRRYWTWGIYQSENQWFSVRESI